LAIWMLAGLVACSDESQPAAKDAESESQPAGRRYSDAEREKICRTAIADINNHPPEIVSVIGRESDYLRLSYVRPSDKKVWTSDCRLIGNRIDWRMVDLLGPGSGPSRWRSDPEDETVTFDTSGSRITITTTYPGETGSSNTYPVKHTKVIAQGMTGETGIFHTQAAR
jgi:dipeptidyl aminopeptidase/acylaminoacyl peptidase